MNLVGEMLAKHLQRDHADSFAVTRLSPPMRRRFTRLHPTNGHFFNADRFLNRFWDYQRWMQRQKQQFDLFHVIDHSYGQLLHNLPPNRTIITCHDLDTFRCLIEPHNEPRSRLFKEMMRHVLKGFRKATHVVCDSVAIRNELVAHGLIAPERVSVIPLGIHPTCSPEDEPAADAEATRLLSGGPTDPLNLLHVGSTIKRKRIDVLLEVLARVREEFPEARLVRVGGPFTPDQIRLIKRFNLEPAIIVLPHLERKVLAAIYRQASLILQPSEAEGFGLPVVEAMACGTPVVASDIPALREVGGPACAYAPVGDVEAWARSASDLINERTQHPDDWTRRRLAGIDNASRFSWSQHANQMAGLYRELLARAQKTRPGSSGLRAY
jgi:glycosyltransferase involved in cell wall biosynthesis